MSWEKMKLKDVCISISDGDHQPPPKANKGVPFVTISNITHTNQFDFSNTMFVPQEKEIFYIPLLAHSEYLYILKIIHRLFFSDI